MDQPTSGGNGAVNGSCGIQVNTCLAGNFVDDPNDTATIFVWNCQGANSGTTANCSISTVPVVIGDIDLSKQLKIWNGENSDPPGTPVEQMKDNEAAISVENGSILTGVANSGSYAFVTNDALDQWHDGLLNLRGIPSQRKSLTSYDFVQMAIRVVPKAGATLPADPIVRFHIYGWQNDNPIFNNSNDILLSQYIVAGGTFNSTYKIVRVPISALTVAGGFSPYTMDSLFFGGSTTGPTNYYIYVDDIYAVDNTPNSIKSVAPLSANTLKLVTAERVLPAMTSDLSAFSITSAQDADFSTPQSPTKIGRENHVVSFEGSSGGSYGVTEAPVVQTQLFLVFNKPLKDGINYTLTINSLMDDRGNSLAAHQTMAFTYVDASVTGSVKASQVGYLRSSPKFAYVGNYLGDAGAMGVANSNNCVVKNIDTNTTTTYPLTFRGNDPLLSGEIIYNCDFSSLTADGNYYVYVPGYGKTFNFKIGPTVYNNVYKSIVKLLYFQRANLKIRAKYAGQWAREAGTSDPDYGDTKVELHSSNYDPSLNPLISATDPVQGLKFPMLRGWYDAGDYGKYVLAGVAPVRDLLFAYELYPSKFTDNAVLIPENCNPDPDFEVPTDYVCTGNGIPDLLDEVKWEVDWMKEMIAPDGGVYDRLTAKQWEQSPYDNHATRYLAPKSTHDTAGYAAVMAQAYRVFKNNAAFEAAHPGYADELLAKARSAWAFLLAHPRPLPENGTDVTLLGIGGGDYPDTRYTNCQAAEDAAKQTNPPNDAAGIALLGTAGCPYSDVDNRAWAAAELYKSTGEVTFHNAFKQYWSQLDPFGGAWNKFQHTNSFASLTYFTTTQYPVDGTSINTIRLKLQFTVNENVGYATDNLYRNVYRSDVRDWIGWGNYAVPLKAYDLIQAYVLLGDTRALNAAKVSFDTQLGANPQYLSYITGIGSTSPQNPLSLTSVWLRQNNGATAPMPGITVFGPNNYASMGNACVYAAQHDTNIYPSLINGDYPTLRRYFDLSCFVEQSEFGVGTIAPVIAAYAYFSDYTGQ